MEEGVGAELQMKKKVLDFIKKYQMIQSGDRVCAGFSGGADSVCLLVVLQELSGELGFCLEAVHVNHNLRGAESDADQVFAEEFCRRRGIPLHLYSCFVKDRARDRRCGLEEAGRYARHEAYRDCAEKFGIQKIALAHHQNDAAETLLFHLARGTSLTGLAGIRPVRDRIIRPLLCVSRAEIEAELRSRGLAWRTDSSNLQDVYTRNCIRHQVLPVLETAVNARTVAHMAAAGEDLLEADAFIREEAKKRERQFCRFADGKGWLLETGLREEAPLLVRRVILSVLGKASGSLRNLERVHIESVEALFYGQTGKRVSLPGHLLAVREYGGVRIRQEADAPETVPCPEKTGLSGEGVYHFREFTADCRLCVPGEKIPEKTYTKWLDYDRISNGLVLRTRRPGDYVVISRLGGRKKLKDYMIDEKIPRRERESILLLASGSEIFWVVGYRISESCKVRESTERVMRIQITGGYADEREDKGSDR